jgi:hypothetical protein
MTVMNLQGQTVYTEMIPANPGSITKDLDFSGFAKGIYYIRLVSEKSAQVEKIILK